MNYSEIVDPSNNNKYSIFSKQGKYILRKYIKAYKLGGAIHPNHELLFVKRAQFYLRDPTKKIPEDFYRESLQVLDNFTKGNVRIGVRNYQIIPQTANQIIDRYQNQN